MKLLALDTAANLCSAAILDTESGRMLAEISEDIGKGHAERLMAVMEHVLAQAETDLDDIARIAVSVGPGSFTGVRVGVSTARGFALALKCETVGISTLEALAHDAGGIFPGRPILSVIDARRDELYAQFFAEDGKAASQPAVTTLPPIIAQLQALSADPVLAGSGAALVNAQLDRKLDIAVAGATGSIRAFAALGALRGPGPDAPVPLYLRGLDVKPQQGFVLKRQGAA
ncbi:MAG: tRNA (adenosine(37)-N6)-threonylcarbamoyltransferase complex dimerization subunit type 1 TsaB [Phyllobacterium sp.]